MKKSDFKLNIVLIFSILVISVMITDCKKIENPINFTLGTFPDTIINMQEINSEYDDYNLDLYSITGNSPIIFSSNRKSSGGQFDLEQGMLAFTFDQTNGAFQMAANMIDDSFLDKLISSAVTSRDDFGPFRFFSSVDGYEYMVLSSRNSSGNLDFFYLKNRPYYGAGIPEISGPVPIRLFNTSSDDAYLCFDLNQDSAYFTSDRNGNFDIFLHAKPAQMEMSAWFNLDFASSTIVEGINSPYDDKCPIIFNNIMVFTSNRPGGHGGFDLYYSLFRNGTWNSPLNLGPGINTAADEYRPVIGFHPEFTNYFLMFSSSRSGGRGGFDLYFTGEDFKEK